MHRLPRYAIAGVRPVGASRRTVELQGAGANLSLSLQRFDALVGQEVVGRTLANAITRQRVHHAYLFCGPRGVGKTSAARILAMALNCEVGPQADPCGQCASCVAIAGGHSLDVQEIDGASHNGVDHVRQLQETAHTRATLRCRIFIIDEVHMLTNQAFNALLKLLEEPPPAVHFIFATTEPHKVLDTIKSRCQRHDFGGSRRGGSWSSSSTSAGASSCRLSVRRCGSLRWRLKGGCAAALSLLEQVIAYTGDHVDGSAAAACLGLVDRRAVMALLGASAEQDRAGALRQLDALYSAGADLRRFADALVAEVRGLVICGEVAQSDGLIDSDAEHLAELNRLAGLLDPVHGRRWLRVALDAAAEISRTGPRGPCSSSPSCGWPMAPARKRSVTCFISFKVALPYGPARAARRGHSAPSPLTTADRRLVCVRLLLGGPSLRSARRPKRRRRLRRGRSEALRRWRRRRAVSPPSRRSFRRRPFCTPWRSSQPLAATLALAGLRIDGQRLVGRLDDARLAICRQERSRGDVAAALAEHGFVELVIGNLNIKASSGSAQPALSAPPPGVAPAPAAIQEVSPPAAAPEPVKSPAAPAETSVSAAPEPRTSAPPSPPQRDEKLPALDDEAKRLLTLWTSIFSFASRWLKGRLVPFAPVEIEQGTLVLGSESEGLIDTVSELLKPVQLNHESVRSLRSQLVGSEAAPRHARHDATTSSRSRPRFS